MRTFRGSLAVASQARLVTALSIVLALLGGCKPGGNGNDDGGTISLDAGSDAAPPGTDAAAVDSGIPWPDAGDYDAWTPPPDPGDSGMPIGPTTVFGPSVVVDTMTVAPASQGFDLDGDLMTDNQLANLPFGLDMINTGLMDAISMGQLLLLLEFRGVEDPSLTVDDLMMDAAMYNGVDADADLTNNFGGMGTFLVDPMSLDAMSYPLVLFFNTSIMYTDPATLPETLFHGERNSLPFAFPGLGTIMLVNPRIEGNPTPSFGELANGLLGGVIQACALDQIPSPLGSGTLLEVVLTLGIPPDIDVSGDGLETFQLSSGFPSTLVSCTDGDGTVIPNLDPPRCACDERIEDGISMALQFHAVSAVITGVAP
jgi:hypothetical protein